ncbi:ornithine cyclodeaminase family protein [Vitiosangium sp. GDMCC 1.1324]|uniref:ornithine cyclodeaminase family protein n=1 Tax=Vitiosangium sp. (strain GDMCC 1.1324) TaxID=2138576 RepID=UPI000D34C84C|nr:ornithine cyclodeaminase family protein [Vitiosangium sp. GDMCC 1.1324]PTL83572.1 ornithine cyclodeaminase [Vitiosangium sp. GDMCC 1.1324]
MLNTRVLGEQEMRRLVASVGLHVLLDETIAALERTLARFDPSHTELRKRDGFQYQHPHPGVLEWMPVMEVGRQAVVKLVGYNPANVEGVGLPTILSTISLYDVTTGHLRALCDGTFPTALRTGAASAVASRILARPDSRVLGLVGCGAQAVTQTHALSRLFSLERVVVYDRRPETAHDFARRVDFLGLPVEAVPLEQVEREADILCTATSVEVGAGPVISGTHLKPHVHINAVGSDLPGKTELPRDFLLRALVCPDYLPQALVEGECQQLQPGDIGPSLFDLARTPELGRRHQGRPTVFDSTGFALEDQVVLEVLLTHAQNLGIGRMLQLESLADDPRDPYSFLRAQGVLPEAARTDYRAQVTACES